MQLLDFVEDVDSFGDVLHSSQKYLLEHCNFKLVAAQCLFDVQKLNRNNVLVGKGMAVRLLWFFHCIEYL